MAFPAGDEQDHASAHEGRADDHGEHDDQKAVIRRFAGQIQRDRVPPVVELCVEGHEAEDIGPQHRLQVGYHRGLVHRAGGVLEDDLHHHPTDRGQAPPPARAHEEGAVDRLGGGDGTQDADRTGVRVAERRRDGWCRAQDSSDGRVAHAHGRDGCGGWRCSGGIWR